MGERIDLMITEAVVQIDGFSEKMVEIGTMDYATICQYFVGQGLVKSIADFDAKLAEFLNEHYAGRVFTLDEAALCYLIFHYWKRIWSRLQNWQQA